MSRVEPRTALLIEAPRRSISASNHVSITFEVLWSRTHHKGLQAALECWRKGFNVEVLEKADHVSPLGDFFAVSPPDVATLKHYLHMKAEYEKHSCTGMLKTFAPNGTKVWEGPWEWAAPGAKHAAPDVDMCFAIRRPVFTKMQISQHSLDCYLYTASSGPWNAVVSSTLWRRGKPPRL